MDSVQLGPATARIVIADAETTKRKRNSMSDAALARSEKPSDVAMALLPLLVVVLVGFLITGFAVPVVPLHVHQGLGFGTFVVGLVTGRQVAAAVVPLVLSGRFAANRRA